MDSTHIERVYAPIPESEHSRFEVKDPAEVVYFFKTLVKEQERICFKTPQGDCFSELVAVLPEQRRLHFKPLLSALDAQAVASTRPLLCISYFYSIRLQFVLTGVVNEAVPTTGAAVLAAPLPHSLWQRQRRAFYRLATPTGMRVQCRMFLQGEEYTFPLVDVSLGGVGIVVPLSEPHETVFKTLFKEGEKIEPCILEFPHFAPILTELEIRTLFEITRPEGWRYLRVGCRFLQLGVMAENVLSRYIATEERRRQARLRGMD